MLACTNTTAAPDGKLNAIETIAPKKNATAEIIAAVMITGLNVLNNCIADKPGKMIRLEISIVPISRIPKTIVIDVSIARTIV